MLLYCFPVASHLASALAVSHVLLKLFWLSEDSLLQIVVCASSEWAVHAQQEQRGIVCLRTQPTQGSCCVPTLLLGILYVFSL